MNFSIPSKPALNKDGFAKVTFIGLTNDTSEKLDKNGNPYLYSKLVFQVMDTTRKSPITVSVVSSKYTGEFKQVIESMGFVSQTTKETTTTDSEGFEITLDKLADDGFEITTETDEDLILEISDYLDSIRGTAFLAKVNKDKRDFWKLDVSSIKPYNV